MQADGFNDSMRFPAWDACGSRCATKPAFARMALNRSPDPALAKAAMLVFAAPQAIVRRIPQGAFADTF